MMEPQLKSRSPTRLMRLCNFMATMNENPLYLGDAVYAFFDGHGVELRLNHHLSPCLIYLEPEVMAALTAFWEKAKAAAELQAER